MLLLLMLHLLHHLVLSNLLLQFFIFRCLHHLAPNKLLWLLRLRPTLLRLHHLALNSKLLLHLRLHRVVLRNLLLLLLLLLLCLHRPALTALLLLLQLLCLHRQALDRPKLPLLSLCHLTLRAAGARPENIQLMWRLLLLRLHQLLWLLLLQLLLPGRRQLGSEFGQQLLLCRELGVTRAGGTSVVTAGTRESQGQSAAHLPPSPTLPLTTLFRPHNPEYED